MSRLTQLRLGLGVGLLLMSGLVWMPSGASAAPGDAREGYSVPTVEYTNSYANNYAGNNDADNSYASHEVSSEVNSEVNSEVSSASYGESSACVSTHHVALGENLSGIAAAYGISVAELVAGNNLGNANLIYENQALCIPAHGYNAAGDRGSYGEQAAGYGNIKPGESYDPSVGYQNQGYGEQADRYGSQGNSNIRPGESYDPNASYQNERNGPGEQANEYGSQGTYYAVPGQSYDPSLYQDQGTAVQSNSYGNPNDDDLRPGESRWSSD